MMNASCAGVCVYTRGGSSFDGEREGVRDGDENLFLGVVVVVLSSFWGCVLELLFGIMITGDCCGRIAVMILLITERYPFVIATFFTEINRKN